jgi:hypothetical protein
MTAGRESGEEMVGGDSPVPVIESNAHALFQASFRSRTQG